jgi:hypothetical protein
MLKGKGNANTMNKFFAIILLTAIPSAVVAGDISLPANAELEKEWKSQFTALQADMGNRARLAGRIKETLRPDSLIIEFRKSNVRKTPIHAA